MTNNYKKYIVSIEQEVRFLHRCFRDNLDKILREGLASGVDLRSTATLQPKDLETAEGLFNNGKDHGNTIIVLSFPRKVWEESRQKAPFNEVATRKIGYFHPRKKEFVVRPEFVLGWINRNTNEYCPNTYDERKPVSGHKEFDYLFD
ncbi:hypothetical protein HYW74_04790 [Candidatus Pacearchaeota archaeon]|nr:hypothetical protein [Candidatus Pacearchaeota archaeon]